MSIHEEVMMEQDARIHELEKQAMTGDRTAVLLLVSAFRSYRQAADRLLAARYSDGECDAVAIHVFQTSCDEALEALLDGGDGESAPQQVELQIGVVTGGGSTKVLLRLADGTMCGLVAEDAERLAMQITAAADKARKMNGPNGGQ